MGIKELWSVLTPYADRKPMCELRGKIVAIDLAGWVCESLNVVDYFVHPRQHLKNLFFRTCYLIWQDVTPVFVLEGAAPKLKGEVIAKRNELQFRGVKPKMKDKRVKVTQSQTLTQNQAPANDKDKGRTRFNHVLKQCENLLIAMGVQCVQAPGEAEAYCAFLNKKGLVDGVISQDSDCFAYGAVKVYRNFSISTQGTQAAQGGAVDIYDMRYICEKMDFGQHKIIVMGLLCGCDYCPDGIGGIGRDGVLKLFNKYKEVEILNRVRSWRSEDDKYTALEMRVNDKTICSNCGHIGRTQSHTKSGCGICRTNRGCDESLWKEERLSLKAELMLRRKALADEAFPNEEIIDEFLKEPPQIPQLTLYWRQPNIVKFIKQIGHLLQWPELYCFQKFFPLLTRWQVRNARSRHGIKDGVYVTPKEILKKRIVKGVPSLEVLWQDEFQFFKGLIPDDQLKEYETDNPKGMQELWTTIEPLHMFEKAYVSMVASYLKSIEKPKKAKRPTKPTRKKQTVNKTKEPLGSLENLQDLVAATDKIAKTLKTNQKGAKPLKGLQMIDKFLKKNNDAFADAQLMVHKCSTPVTKCLPTSLLLDDAADEDDAYNMSDIINGIVKRPQRPALDKHKGHFLLYESLELETSSHANGARHERSLDDLELLREKRALPISGKKENMPHSKRLSLDDSFDVLVKKGMDKIKVYNKPREDSFAGALTPIDRFKQTHRLSNAKKSLAASMENASIVEDPNVSYFFNLTGPGGVQQNEDAFEKFMEESFTNKSFRRQTHSANSDDDNGDLIIITDSSSDGD